MSKFFVGKWRILRFVSLANALAFDPFNMVDKDLTLPLQIVVGDKIGAFGSYNTGKELYNRAASVDKDFYVIDGASHYDLYDAPWAIEKAVTKLSAFYYDAIG